MHKRLAALICCVAVVAGSALARQHSHAPSSGSSMVRAHHPGGDADGRPAVVTGYVRDIACLLRNPKAGAATTAMTRDCMKQCVRGGSPIGILAEDGRLYTPVSDEIPDHDVRSRFLPYVGKYVRATGRVFERGGMPAISVAKIEVVPRPADSRIPEL